MRGKLPGFLFFAIYCCIIRTVQTNTDMNTDFHDVIEGDAMAYLAVKDLTKTYRSKFGQTVEALRGVSFQAEQGEFLAIMGESGSGKTTLLNILAGLDRQTSGQVTLRGVNVEKISDQDLSQFRRDCLGYVFQDMKLLETFSLRDNIYLPLVLAERPLAEIETRAEALAKNLGIEMLLDKFPYELSGGEKQRGAIARALMNSPALLLADEPTGQLDSQTSHEILDIFAACHAQGQTIIMVTHSQQAAAYASRVLIMKDGRIATELKRDGRDYHQQLEALSRLVTGSGAPSWRK